MASSYTYLPWLRKGLSNQLSQPATVRSRATVVATASVTDGERTAPSVPQEFQLTGPGDITGLDPDAVVRVDPQNWVTDFEPNYLPFIEFYEEDFAWRYTPRGPEGAGSERLIPWLSLLVLTEDEFERNRLPGRPLTSVVVKTPDPADLFPPANQLWAWAHVQAVADFGTENQPDQNLLQSTLTANPDLGLCRVVSPRKLDPETGYFAFVVPTFDVGRRAGLGLEFDEETTSGLALSWENSGEFPIYHEWYFRTGERGDFEELARRLIPREIDKRVGIRDMDVGAPNFGMAGLPGDSADRIVGLEGALKSPQTQPAPHRAGSRFAPDVAAIINQPAIAEANGDGDPVVAPPIYGRWHALVNRVDPDTDQRGWVNSLNRDARFRAAAGLGSEVIRRNQEMFMKRAWQQVGDVLEANRKIALAQAAALANKKLLIKTFESNLDPAFTVALAGRLVNRILAGTKTIKADLGASLVTAATMSGQMRKITRPRGAIEKRLAAPEPGAGVVRPPRIGLLAAQLNNETITPGSRPDDISVVTLEDGLAFIAQRDAGGTPGRPPRPTGPAFPGLDTLAPGRGFAPGVAPRDIRGRFSLPDSAVDLRPTAPTGVSRGRRTLPAATTGRLSRRTATPQPPVAVANVDTVATTALPNRFDGIGFDSNLIMGAKLPDNFRITAPPESNAGFANTTGLGKTRQLRLQKSMGEFSNLLNLALPQAAKRPALDAKVASGLIIQALQPDAAFRKRLDRTIKFGTLALDHYDGGLVVTPRERIVPAMACPDFKDAMYRHLTRLGDEFLVPNLGLVPPNTISLMLTNPSFIEAYMVGLNQEFSSELLFREYPTDQRCSAFRQFWDVANIPLDPGQTPAQQAEALKDIKPIHKWTRASVLGTNSPRTSGHAPASGGIEPRVVLVVRGDLLKKYPNTIIYAQSARFGIGEQKNELILHDEDGSRAAADINDPDIYFPTFKAQVAPDLHFIGFNLTLSEVRGHRDLEETAAARSTIPASQLGKYFVIQEVAGETRFGLDVSAPAQPSDEQWDNLAWPNIDLSAGPVVDVAKAFTSMPAGTDTTGFVWGANSADLASILYQKPAMLAIHGREMLKDL